MTEQAFENRAKQKCSFQKLIMRVLNVKMRSATLPKSVYHCRGKLHRAA